MTAQLFDAIDILVVGAGMAGLCAALTAAELGFQPVILEAAPEVGGTSALSDGVFNAFDPERQIQIDVSDSPEKHLEQLIQWGASRANRSLAKVLCYEAPTTLKWLERLGLELPDNVVQAPASPYPRSHVPAKGGRAYIDFLHSEIDKRRIPVLTNCKATKLLRSNADLINTVEFKRQGMSHRLTSRYGIVLASGGFTRNKAMLRSHMPLLQNISTPAAEHCDGIMLLAAQDCGAAVTHMCYFIWDWGKNNIDPWLLSDASKYILVNSRGERFIREDVRKRDQIEACLIQSPAKAWVISRGDGKTVSATPFSKAKLKQTLQTYNNSVISGIDKECGKLPVLLKSINEPVSIEKLEPVIQVSLGGLCINSKAQVIDRYGNPIQGLTAAGDITGGIYGEWAARGDCLAGAAVYGRIAAFTLCKDAFSV